MVKVYDLLDLGALKDVGYVQKCKAGSAAAQILDSSRRLSGMLQGVERPIGSFVEAIVAGGLSVL